METSYRLTVARMTISTVQCFIVSSSGHAPALRRDQLIVVCAHRHCMIQGHRPSIQVSFTMTTKDLCILSEDSRGARAPHKLCSIVWLSVIKATSCCVMLPNNERWPSVRCMLGMDIAVHTNICITGHSTPSTRPLCQNNASS